MADEDATLPGGEDARQPNPHEREKSEGLSFSLPPISLPEMQFPERIRLVFPIPEPPEKVSKPVRVQFSQVLLVLVLADVLDALVVALAGPPTLPWVRAVVGTLLSILSVGPLGLLYSWELLAILGDMGWLSLAPTLTLLLVVQMVFSR